MFYLHNGYADGVFHYNDVTGAQLWKNRDYYNELFLNA